MQKAFDAVLVKSVDVDKDAVECRGHNFEEVEKTGKVDYEKLFQSLTTTGFQATNFARAVEIVREMRRWRLSDEPIKEDEDEDLKDPKVRENIKCTIFLGYTSNMISCGVRESLLYLAKNKLVDVMVTTAGGIEEDFLKCLAPHYMGDFSLDGATLRGKGLNRIGNLIVPNNNYCKFEDFLKPLIEKMHDEQEADGTVWTPAKIIRRLGKEINDERSVYYWCYKNDIPVYCPAITDGSIGDMVFFHSVRRPGFVIDIVQDITRLNKSALEAKCTGMLIAGGGLIKHHICNANLMRNGANYSVFINTASDFDGSDSGAKPDEAISWGKIKLGAPRVKVHGDASLLLPLLVARAFAEPL